MNPERMRVKIAEVCGWKTQRESWPSGEKITWLAPYQVAGYLGSYSPPDYFNDLNAMHEAEKFIADRIEEYVEEVRAVILEKSLYLKTKDERKMLYPMFATAAQRAEAFLKTLGRWEDDAEGGT